jgi:hypothetical protein
MLGMAMSGYSVVDIAPPPEHSEAVPAQSVGSDLGAMRGLAELALVPSAPRLPVAAGTPNPWVLKRLTQRHKDMIVLSLQGLEREKVAEYCGCTPQYVTMINRQPLARAYIAELEQHLDLRLRGMYSKSLDAIDAGLKSPKISDKLAAAQIHLRALGKDVPGPDTSKQTAEDVVGAMLVQGTNVQINNYR